MSFQAEKVWNFEKNPYKLSKRQFENLLGFHNIFSSQHYLSPMLNWKLLRISFFFNYYQGFKIQSYSTLWYDLRIRLVIIMFSSFNIVFDMFDVLFLSIKATGISYFLWHRHYYCLKIKYQIFFAYSLYKYIWEIVTYIFLASKTCSEPDIWLKSLGWVKNMESVMKIIYDIKINYWQSVSKTPNSLLFATSKEAKQIRLLIFCD